MQSELDSDEFDRESNSEYYNQRIRRKRPPKARKRRQQYSEDSDSDGLVRDCSSEDEWDERNISNRRSPIRPPPQRKVAGVNHLDEEEEAMESEESEPVSPAEVDVMHLAPMRVEETADWPEPIEISNVRLRRNENFGGDRKEEMGDVSNDYYKSCDHFVWTNQLVVGNGVELEAEENYRSRRFRCQMKIINDPQVMRFPENVFRLRKKFVFGYGLFAERFIAKGTIIGEYTGELVAEKNENRRRRIYKAHKMPNYFYQTEKPGLLIDACTMGNHTRFINHSCDDYNCEVHTEIIAGVPKIWVVATEDIPQGHELFLNYGPEYFDDLECLCEGDNCVEREKETRWLEELKRLNSEDE